MQTISRDEADVGTDDVRHNERAIAFFGFWSITGLYIDGWAHLNDKPETFFSPWHLVMYSGVAAAIAYFAVRGFLANRTLAGPDGLTIAGLAILVAGAIGDGLWHEIFGIEVSIEALMSPTHLMLLSGGLLMLSYGVRAASARGGQVLSMRQFWPTMASLTLTLALAIFFTQYLAAYRWTGLWSTQAQGMDEQFVVHTISAVLLTNALLLGAVLYAVRSWDVPGGAFAIMYGTIALGCQALDEFEAPAQVVGAVLAGLIPDVLAARFRPRTSRRRMFAFAGAVALVTWSLWLVALVMTRGVRWSPELWAGIVFLAVLESIGLAVLVFPPQRELLSGSPRPLGAHADRGDEPFGGLQ